MVRVVRARPLMRAAVVGGTAYAAGKAGAKKGAQEQQKGTKGGEASLSDKQVSQIEKLSKLHDSGSLTDEEFTRAKNKVLGIE